MVQNGCDLNTMKIFKFKNKLFCLRVSFSNLNLFYIITLYMIMQRIGIIVGDAGFEPAPSAPEVWCATNEPPHFQWSEKILQFTEFKQIRFFSFFDRILNVFSFFLTFILYLPNLHKTNIFKNSAFITATKVANKQWWHKMLTFWEKNLENITCYAKNQQHAK